MAARLTASDVHKLDKRAHHKMEEIRNRMKVTNDYITVADLIEDTSSKIHIFYTRIQEVKEEIRYLNSMGCSNMSLIRSNFITEADGNLMWLYAQMSFVKRVYAQLTVTLMHTVWDDGPDSWARQLVNDILKKAGKSSAKSLHGNPRSDNMLANAKENNIQKTEASEIQNETKPQLLAGVVSSPKDEQVPHSPASACLQTTVGDTSEADAEVLPQETDGGAEQVQASGAGSVDHEGLQGLRSGHEAGTVQPPLREGNQAASEDPPKTKETDNNCNSSDLSTMGTVSSNSKGGSDGKSNHNVKANGCRKCKDKNKSTIAQIRLRRPMIEENQPINRESTAESVVYIVWELLDQLLSLNMQHMHRMSELQSFLGRDLTVKRWSDLERDLLLDVPLQLMEDQLMETHRRLVPIANAARTLDNAAWWPKGQTNRPQIPTGPLRPIVRRRVVRNTTFGQRIWRFFCIYFLCRLP